MGMKEEKEIRNKEEWPEGPEKIDKKREEEMK